MDTIPGKMLKSKKHVFWEALLVTIGIFLIGLFLGMLVETGNASQINNLYLQSEISLVDGAAAFDLSKESDLSCEDFRANNIAFADKIYEEAKLLEELETSGKLTDGMKYLHKKYDLLRTLLWMNNKEYVSKCDNYNTVIYLYEYESEDNYKKATQNVWSKILLDLKLTDENVLLIPIAADQELASLDLLLKEHGVSRLPAIVVNDKEVIYALDNIDQVQSLLN